MPFSKFAIDKFISDKISKITECGLADLSAEFQNSKTWMSGLGLMIILANQPPEAARPFALQFVPRVEMVISEYSSARREILDLIASKPSWSPYFRALHHVEIAVALLYQAYDFSSQFSKKFSQEPLFETGVGSPHHRLNRIYAASKHHLADAAGGPLWLSNESIETRNYRVGFAEFEELARECARVAEPLTKT